MRIHNRILEKFVEWYIDFLTLQRKIHYLRIHYLPASTVILKPWWKDQKIYKGEISAAATVYGNQATSERHVSSSVLETPSCLTENPTSASLFLDLLYRFWPVLQVYGRWRDLFLCWVEWENDSWITKTYLLIYEKYGEI